MTSAEAYAQWRSGIQNLDEHPDIVAEAFNAGFKAASIEASNAASLEAREYAREMRDAVAEARWEGRQGDEYGSY